MTPGNHRQQLHHDLLSQAFTADRQARASERLAAEFARAGVDARVYEERAHFWATRAARLRTAAFGMRLVETELQETGS